MAAESPLRTPIPNRLYCVARPQPALDAGERLRNSIEILVDFPRAGRPGRVVGTHALIIANTPFIAICRIDDDRGEVHIIRFLHAWQK